MYTVKYFRKETGKGVTIVAVATFTSKRAKQGFSRYMMQNCKVNEIEEAEHMYLYGTAVLYDGVVVLPIKENGQPKYP